MDVPLSAMTTVEVFESASAKEIFFILFFMNFPLVVLFVLYLIIFRELPIGNPIKDAKLAWKWLTTWPEEMPEGTYGGYNEDDYYEDIYGDDDADSRPRVRHPKNVDRAYYGGAERFHHGGR